MPSAVAVFSGVLCLLAASVQTSAAQSLDGVEPQLVPDAYVAAVRNLRVETWSSGLDTPWSLLFLPDGRALVSERPGRIRLVGADGRLRPTPYAEIADTVAEGEGGLMGLALHPRFPDEPYVYAMGTRSVGGKTVNSVFRLRHAGDHAVFDREILGGIPAGLAHNGGRIAFGPDGMLYIPTGDSWVPDLAQDHASLAGKILRVTPDGGIPDDNPFPNSPVYSYGHRNVQGLAWHPRNGTLFASEHGPTGERGLYAHDEINVVVPGGNYGWPLAACAVKRAEFVDPVVCWRTTTTPPSGIAFHKGDLFVASLGGRSLIRIAFTPNGGPNGGPNGAGGDAGFSATAIERWFAVPLEASAATFGDRATKAWRKVASGWQADSHGRLRDVVEGPDGRLYVLTNNRNGGPSENGEDRILKLTTEGPPT